MDIQNAKDRYFASHVRSEPLVNWLSRYCNGNRAITFCLTFCITCVICCGLTITVVAGVALGYNYSFAEFITHTKSDVTVFVQRGQFYEQPEIVPSVNRRMGDEVDLFSSNITSDYEEQVISKNHSESLSEKWLKDDDAREYAIKLTKYKGNERMHTDTPQLRKQEKIKPIYASTLPSTRRLSSIPIVIPTTIWRSESSEIVLRKFLPLHKITENFNTKVPVGDFDKDSSGKYVASASEIEYSRRQQEKIEPDIKIRFDDSSESKLQPIHDSATNYQDDFIEEDSENNIIYKPV